MRYIRHARLALTLTACLLVGCSSLGDLLRFKTTGPQPTKPEPAASFDLQEYKAQLRDFEFRLLAKIDALGAPAHAPAVSQAIAAHVIAGADEPGPATPLPAVPPDLSALVDVDEAIDRTAALQLALAEDRHEWKGDIAERASKPASREWRFGIPALGGLAGVAIVGWGLSVLVRYVLKWRGGFFQTFTALRSVLFNRSDDAMISAKDLKQALRDKQKLPTKALVDGLQRKIGDK